MPPKIGLTSDIEFDWTAFVPQELQQLDDPQRDLPRLAKDRRESPEPFVGFFLLLEEHVKSTQPVGVIQRHFPVVEEFRGASYVQRCEYSLRRMVRERCYNGAAFVLSSQPTGLQGAYSEPANDLGFSRFVRLMCGHAKTSLEALTSG